MDLQRDFLDFEIYPKIKIAKDLNFIYKNNAKNTLVLIKDANSTNMEFLSKILTAIKFDIENDILLVEVLDNQKVNFSEFKKSISTKIENVILFGVQPESLALQFRLPKYYKLTVNNIHYLGAEDLTIISKNNAKKKELWTALQTMF